MKVAINCGHTKSGAGYGAVSGKYKESDIVRAVGKELIRVLRSKGHTVHDCTVDSASSQNAYLKESVRLSNSKDVDLFISLHCNASASHSANGVEVYTYKGKKLDQAVHVCYELSLKGFRNRGIKDGSNLYVVKNTKATAMLVELFFLDNVTDQKLYSNVGYKTIARAIANAI